MELQEQGRNKQQYLEFCQSRRGEWSSYIVLYNYGTLQERHNMLEQGLPQLEDNEATLVWACVQFFRCHMGLCTRANWTHLHYASMILWDSAGETQHARTRPATIRGQWGHFSDVTWGCVGQIIEHTSTFGVRCEAGRVTTHKSKFGIWIYHNFLFVIIRRCQTFGI